MELSRFALGFLAAVAVPMSVPAMRRNALWILLFSSTYAAYVTFPILSLAKAAPICLIAAIIAFLVARRRAMADSSAVTTPPAPGARRLIPTLTADLKHAPSGILRFCRSCIKKPDIMTAVFLIVVAAALGAGLYHSGSLPRLLQNDKTSIAASAALVAVFAGNEFVLLIISPYLRQLQAQNEDIGAIVPTGLHIGWIERMIVFSFIAAGEPAAAALAVAAKSVIRIPEVHLHAGVYAQYVLVGTFADLLVALLVAVALRTFIGLSPL